MDALTTDLRTVLIGLASAAIAVGSVSAFQGRHAASSLENPP